MYKLRADMEIQYTAAFLLQLQCKECTKFIVKALNKTLLC